MGDILCMDTHQMQQPIRVPRPTPTRVDRRAQPLSLYSTSDCREHQSGLRVTYFLTSERGHLSLRSPQVQPATAISNDIDKWKTAPFHVSSEDEKALIDARG